jgi:hypothetical protein
MTDRNQPDLLMPADSAAQDSDGQPLHTLLQIGNDSRRTLAVVGALVIAAFAGAYAWLSFSPQTPSPVATRAGLKVAEAPTQEVSAGPAPTATAQELPAAESPRILPVPPVAAKEARAVGAAPQKPSEPPVTAKTPPVKSRTAAATPREACGNRSRFALYQCLQEQCAKPAWSKHAQCVRLRKEQKLG